MAVSDAVDAIVVGAVLGTFIGTCIGICAIIRKFYMDIKLRETDVANITKNILHVFVDEETGPKIDYMTARPIV